VSAAGSPQTSFPAVSGGAERTARPPAPRRTGRARRGEGDLLREEILEAFAALIVEHGRADKISTRAVARRVGCSSPALYLHFPDKAALVYAACERQFLQIGAQMDAAMAGIDDPAERLRVSAKVYARFALDHPEQYRVMMMDHTYGDLLHGSLEEVGARAGMATVVQTVQEGMDRGMFVPGDALLTALGMWAVVHGLVSLLLAKPGLAVPPVEELVDLMADQMLDGMRVRSPG
jgi:AcrR family transcriptional regulator